MSDSIPRACLTAFLAVATTTACDVEPASPPAAPSEPRVASDRDAVEPAVMAAASEGSSLPDLVARAAPRPGGNPMPPERSPGASNPSGSFPAAECREGYTQRGSRLCISDLRAQSNYPNASSVCRNDYGHVCTYEDLTYVYLNSTSDASYNPNARFMGPMSDDDRVYCGNRNITFDNDPDISNFESQCSKNGERRYWCCHDRE
jgi:hypothetical protein